MAYEFKLPDLGEGLTEGEVARWLVAEGQEIAEDDPLVEIQTDKTTVEIPSPAAGTVARILVAEGEIAPVGAVLVVIENGSAPAAQPATSAGAGGDARRSKPRSRLSDDDARPGNAARPPGRPGPGRRPRLDRRLGRGRPRDRGRRARRGHVRGQTPGHASEGRRLPIRGVRRLIVEHLTTAHREIPAVTFVEECDFTASTSGASCH